MTPMKEIGECLISTQDADYMFRPSFANMMRIGEPQEIVQAFSDLHSDEVTPLIDQALAAYGQIPAWLVIHLRAHDYGKRALLAAMSVLDACGDRDLSELIGYFRPAKAKGKPFKRRLGVMSDYEIVLIAQSLITHGIIGKAKVRQLQRHENSQGTSEFSAYEYISAARNHFGISREEAERLTMTEFQHMLNAKYPDQKGFTRDEYDAVADDYIAKKARRLAKAKQ